MYIIKNKHYGKYLFWLLIILNYYFNIQCLILYFLFTNKSLFTNLPYFFLHFFFNGPYILTWNFWRVYQYNSMKVEKLLSYLQVICKEAKQSFGGIENQNQANRASWTITVRVPCLLISLEVRNNTRIVKLI